MSPHLQLLSRVLRLLCAQRLPAAVAAATQPSTALAGLLRLPSVDCGDRREQLAKQRAHLLAVTWKKPRSRPVSGSGAHADSQMVPGCQQQCSWRGPCQVALSSVGTGMVAVTRRVLRAQKCQATGHRDGRLPHCACCLQGCAGSPGVQYDDLVDAGHSQQLQAQRMPVQRAAALQQV